MGIVGVSCRTICHSSSGKNADTGCFPLCRRFRSEFKWKGPKFAFPFLTNRFFPLIREFGKGMENGKSNFYWLARFNRKMSFHFPRVFPPIISLGGRFGIMESTHWVHDKYYWSSYLNHLWRHQFLSENNFGFYFTGTWIILSINILVSADTYHLCFYFIEMNI